MTDPRSSDTDAWQVLEAGFSVLNDVVLNQVLVSFGDAERTGQVIAAIQEEERAGVG